MLFAGFILVPAGRAQSAPQISDNRYLFIFDTSADMKKRLRAVQMEVNQVLATSMGGQLHTGDSLGVWTFNQNLRAGQFPLQRWQADDAVTIASSINKLIGKQRYANKTRFSALQPELNQVIRDSGRLTVLIFSDGEDEIKWTPYDDGINQAFKERMAEQKKTRRPFVLVFRTQLGKYVGCSMNFQPGMLNVPEFPPVPPPPALVKTPPPAPPPAPVIKPQLGPPLIIVGTTVETNWPPANAVPAAPINPVVPTNLATPPPSNPAPATPMNLAPIPAPNRTAPTNAVASSPENSGSGHEGALAIGVALMVAAVALVALAIFRRRRTDRNSLITHSMKKD